MSPLTIMSLVSVVNGTLQDNKGTAGSGISPRSAKLVLVRVGRGGETVVASAKFIVDVRVFVSFS